MCINECIAALSNNSVEKRWPNYKGRVIRSVATNNNNSGGGKNDYLKNKFHFKVINLAYREYRLALSVAFALRQN